MGTSGTASCKNCGAALEPTAGGILRCAYCGTVYHTETSNNESQTNITLPTVNDNETSAEAAAVQRHWDDMQNGGGATSQAPASPPKSDNAGCIVAVFLFIVVGGIIFAMITKNMGRGSSADTDSLATDTSAQTRPQPKQLSDTELASLKLLSVISVDKTQFKALYKAAKIRTTNDIPMLESTYLEDKNTPAGKTQSGLYAHQEFDQDTYLIYLNTQYFPAKAPNLTSLTFTIDGKKIRYTPSFSTDTLQHQLRITSNEVIYDEKLPILIKLATGKKVMISFNNGKHRQQISLPADQQEALKRQLQLYKGLLSGYAKP